MNGYMRILAKFLLQDAKQSLCVLVLRKYKKKVDKMLVNTQYPL